MATKAQVLADPNSCLNKAADDEPIFVFRAQDRLSVGMLQEYANRLGAFVESTSKKEQTTKDIAEFIAWQEMENPDIPGSKLHTTKVPD